MYPKVLIQKKTFESARSAIPTGLSLSQTLKMFKAQQAFCFKPQMISAKRLNRKLPRFFGQKVCHRSGYTVVKPLNHPMRSG